jgi:hypothetical protein
MEDIRYGKVGIKVKGKVGNNVLNHLGYMARLAISFMNNHVQRQGWQRHAASASLHGKLSNKCHK